MAVTAPTEILAALFLTRLLVDHNELALYMHKEGARFTADEDTCRSYLMNGNVRIDEEQVAAALLYAAISRTPPLSPTVLASSLRKELKGGFNWQHVVAHFDQQGLRVTGQQFLSLYVALLPIALDDSLDIQRLWGGIWQNSETQLSFLGAYAFLTPNELDASRIPGVKPTFTIDEFSASSSDIQARGAFAVRHPLISTSALTAIFHVALGTEAASGTVEANRLFQEAVVPNLDIFMVSAFGVQEAWSVFSATTLDNLLDKFITKQPNHEFVLESLWRRDKTWVAKRLVELHAQRPLELPTILEHVVKHGWLEDLSSILNGFMLDLVALAHAQNRIDLEQWARSHASHEQDLAAALLEFLNAKANHELIYLRSGSLVTVMLPVKTISALLIVLEGILPKTPSKSLIVVQRTCITAYPRLINYGEGYDDIIDANGKDGNSLPPEANDRMEEHYKSMYSQDLEVVEVVNALEGYKHSRDPASQEVFACMIHGLFDEYSLYGTYPLEALATTAVLFGGIISRRLISDLPLEIGLGMILEAVRDNPPDASMHKFGLQALQQLYSRLQEWPGFCKQLLQVPQLQGTEAWKHAEDIVARNEQEEIARMAIEGGPRNQHINGAFTNGSLEDMLDSEPTAPPFASINPDPSPYSNIYEDPNEDTQDKVQFVLNNITEQNVESKFQELKDVIDVKHQQWFAGHLVEERAKLQPNYHGLYLELVKLFQNKSLWSEVLRETYVSVIRMLNAESTMKSSSERTHLKNLGGWLGSLTLARDKPIKHRNIAFKQLLLEAFDTQRLVVVIPFVCKVLIQGASSTVFKPPNPWLMDIIHLLIELYHHAELKLNQKFEIEVLCKGLNLDHKTIEPSTDIMTRAPLVEETSEVLVPEMMDRFDNLSMNGMGGGAASGRFSPQEITSTLPDLGPLLIYPPVNDMVNQNRLQDIVRSAITRAVHEIIAPVVERSVTIAAISTAQMIRKDFATEPNEQRVRAAAINMVKKTAGSLALVTSKEPLRASMTNYIRALQIDLPQVLPEGTIIMCVNSNLDLACNQVEKRAEERAVPEIEEMIEPELEARRRHRALRGDEPFVDPQLSRWAWTIPQPYRLQPSMNGLNQDQMAIYDEFARIQPRAPSVASNTHVASSSDATRSMANEILQDHYAVSSLQTPAETPAMPLINSQPPSYNQANAGISNGRSHAVPVGPQILPERVQNLFSELQRAAASAPEQHYADLPRPHPILDILDALYSLIIRSQQFPEAFDIWIANQICAIVFGGTEDDLVVESLVHMLQNICRIGGRTANQVYMNIGGQPFNAFQNVALICALIGADMVDWSRIDLVTAKALSQRKEGSLDFFSALLDRVLLNDAPIALYTDFSRSLEVAYEWIAEEPTLEIGQTLKQRLTSSGLPHSIPQPNDDRLLARQTQMEYVFNEWFHLCSNPNASEKALHLFIHQMYNKQIINSRDDLCLFLRTSIDSSVERFERHLQTGVLNNEAYVPIDALAKLIALLATRRHHEGEVKNDKAAFLNTMLSLSVLVLNHHHVTRGEHFNQKVFLRLYSTLLSELSSLVQSPESQPLILTFAENLVNLRPAWFPGFMFGWLSLISHRDLLHPLMQISDGAGWESCCKIVEALMSYAGELLRPVNASPVARDLYHSVTKLHLILQHDFPEFVAANHSRLCAAIPHHCIQLRNLILNANPTPISKMPDPLQPGLKIDRIDEIRNLPLTMLDVESPLRKATLLGVLSQALHDGPSEDAVAHITHTIQRPKGKNAASGHVPMNVDLSLIDAIVLHIGTQSLARAMQRNSPSYMQDSADAKLISMLVHELNPEARYYFINSMVDQLRFPNAHTHYFMQALLDIFGTDQHDPEESEIQQQISRILLERSIGQFPQPWGLLITILELVKNERYMFFDLPFIKSAPDVSALLPMPLCKF